MLYEMYLAVLKFFPCKHFRERAIYTNDFLNEIACVVLNAVLQEDFPFHRATIGLP